MACFYTANFGKSPCGGAFPDRAMFGWFAGELLRASSVTLSSSSLYPLSSFSSQPPSSSSPFSSLFCLPFLVNCLFLSLYPLLPSSPPRHVPKHPEAAPLWLPVRCWCCCRCVRGIHFDLYSQYTDRIANSCVIDSCDVRDINNSLSMTAISAS